MFLALVSALLAVQVPSLTVPLLQHLREGDLFAFDSVDETFHHQGKRYVVLRGESSHHASVPYASLSSHPLAREIILLNPDSPTLDACYRALKVAVGGSTPHAVLTKLVAYVSGLFPHAAESVEPFISRICQPRDFTETRLGVLLPVLPLDTFLKFGIGVCRHRALLLAYLADRLMMDGLLPKGRCHHVRSPIHERHGQPLNHAWNLYLSDDGALAFHLDASWQRLDDLNDPNWKTTLTTVYSEAAVAKIEALSNR